MNEKMIAGYAAFTTAEELGAAAVGDAPATTPLTFVLVVISGGSGVGAMGSIMKHC